jgi:AcrR family transcriptional regulator
MTPTTPTPPRRRDRRRIRHEATKQEILDTAWSIVRADGLAALSLRAIAHAVDMEPQSLYTYFASKNALYDHMFADGNQELASRLAAAEIPEEPRSALQTVTRLFVDFATEDQASYQLLFLRTLPGFQPSPESYAIAVKILTSARTILTRAGIRDETDFDLWTAVIAGLASQQLANDPGGDRYIRLIDNAVTMYADHTLDPSQPHPADHHALARDTDGSIRSSV